MTMMKNVAGKKRCAAFFLAAAIGTGSFMGMQMLPGTAQGLQLGNEAVMVQAASKPSAATLAAAVKKAYGDDYLPAYLLGESEIKDRYGVSGSWYASSYAEVPLMTAHVDELVIFKAKNKDSGKKILKALKKYQKQLKESTLNYPMNQLKIQASRVYKNGDYICFIMLGRISSQTEENGGEEDIIKAYQKQNNKAVKAIKKQLK